MYVHVHVHVYIVHVYTKYPSQCSDKRGSTVSVINYIHVPLRWSLKRETTVLCTVYTCTYVLYIITALSVHCVFLEISKFLYPYTGIHVP